MLLLETCERNSAMYSPNEIESNPLTQTAVTDPVLIERVQDWSDEESWRKFCDIYVGLVHSMASKAGLSDHEAKEVAQLTMIAVAHAIRNFEYDRQRGSFKAWLYSHAKWRIRDQFRLRQRDNKMFLRHQQPATSTGTETIARLPDPRDDHQELLESEWNEYVAQTAYDTLKVRVKPKHFQIFDLATVKQWPLRRISRTLCVSVPQVCLIKHRVSYLLKKQTRQVKAQLERPPSPGFIQKNQNTKNK